MTKDRNPKSSGEFFSLPVGPDPNKTVSMKLFPLLDGDILGIMDKKTKIYWKVWQHTDGTRFRYISGKGNRHERTAIAARRLESGEGKA